MRIVFASFNHNKYSELKQSASTYGLDLLLPRDLENELNLESLADPDETGNSYLENARIKALAAANWSKMPAIGDDSGLEVDALDGKPGIHSKRYGKSDQDRITKLLKELEHVPFEKRTCRFRSVLVFYNPRLETEISSEGILEGRVLFSPKGHRGFGYDPIIHINELGSTLAEITEEKLSQVGFRAKAGKELFSKILNFNKHI